VSPLPQRVTPNPSESAPQFDLEHHAPPSWAVRLAVWQLRLALSDVSVDDPRTLSIPLTQCLRGLSADLSPRFPPVVYAAAVNRMMADGWWTLSRDSILVPSGMIFDRYLSRIWAEGRVGESDRSQAYTLSPTPTFRRLLESDRLRRGRAGEPSRRGLLIPVPAAAVERAAWRLRRSLATRFAAPLADGAPGDAPPPVDVPLAELLAEPAADLPRSPYHAVETAAAIRTMVGRGLLEPAGVPLPPPVRGHSRPHSPTDDPKVRATLERLPTGPRSRSGAASVRGETTDEDAAPIRSAVRPTGLMWAVLMLDRRDDAAHRTDPLAGLPAPPLTPAGARRVVGWIGEIVLKDGLEVVAGELRFSLGDLLGQMDEHGVRAGETLDALGTLWAERVIQFAILTGDDGGQSKFLFKYEHLINGHPRGTVARARFMKAIEELQGRQVACREGVMVFDHPATVDQLKHYELPLRWAVERPSDGPQGGDTVVWNGVSHRVPKGNIYQLFVFFWNRTKPASFSTVKKHLDSDAEPKGLIRIVRRFIKKCPVVQVPWTILIDGKNERFVKKSLSITSTSPPQSPRRK